jgi:hypothetical protein
MSRLARIVTQARSLVGLEPAFRAQAYWEERYASGGGSGTGSEGANYEFKRDHVRHVMRTHGVRTAVDFGCGDGRQLHEILTGDATRTVLDEYLGLDVSPSAVARCRDLYRGHPNCRFDVYGTAEVGRYDLALSLDVLYHIVDYQDYVAYLRRLFGCSQWVLLYANREAKPSEVPHVVYRDNLAEIGRLVLPTELVEQVPHPRKSTGFALFRNSPAQPR